VKLTLGQENYFEHNFTRAYSFKWIMQKLFMNILCMVMYWWLACIWFFVSYRSFEAEILIGARTFLHMLYTI